jgi:serine/threonine-protein kinase
MGNESENPPVRLRVTAGPHEGREFEFAGHDTFIVGRSSRAHFRLPQGDHFGSRFHFLLEINPPSCSLSDLGSHNGTYVNEQKVMTADLKDGDVIRAGETAMRISIPLWDGGPAPPAPHTPTVAWRPADAGEGRIGDYLLERELGRGAMGVVYLAAHEGSGAPFAVKTLHPAVEAGSAEVQRFLREARILQGLDHPHVVAFREMGEAGGELYFVMEYVPGTDAGRLVKQHGPLPVARAVRLTCQLLDALAHAHAKGFVHRDIKPSNLLVTERAGQEWAMLADFGLGRVYQESKLSGLSVGGKFGGTIPFMAPEQITHFRESKPPVDQYAAAAALYNLLTARYLYDFPRTAAGRLAVILQEDPVPIRQRRADVPGPLADAIHRGLARDPRERFADVRALRGALLPFQT